MKDERWHKVAYELQDCTVTLFKDGVPVYNTTDPALCGMSHSLQQLQIQAGNIIYYMTIRSILKKRTYKATHEEKSMVNVGWLYWYFTALRHILGHFGHGHLT